MKPTLGIAVLPVHVILMVLLIFLLQSKTGNEALEPHGKENEGGFSVQLRGKVRPEQCEGLVLGTIAEQYQAGTRRPFPPEALL